MKFPYSRSRQGLYALGVVMMITFGLFLVYMGYDLQDSIQLPDNSSRSTKRMARKANTFSILIMIGGAITAIMALKPGQVLYASTQAFVEVDDQGLTYATTTGSGSARWADVRKATLDDFTGLEIKVNRDIIVIPKEYENWDELVALIKSKVPSSS